MKRARIGLLMAALCMTCVFSKAEVNDKFMKKAAKEVWEMKLPAFDPTTVIPDSIAEGNSAVVIAEYTYIEGDFEEGTNYAKVAVAGTSNTSITKLKMIHRRMIKLYDESAIEEFADMELDGSHEEKMGNYPIIKVDEACGARVYKPSGEMIEVDMREALSVTTGKKGKEEIGRKLQIPGLAPGDIIDIFTYEYAVLDEFSAPPFDISIIGRYPIMHYELQCVFDSRLTVEYLTVNGAPMLGTGYDDNENLTATIDLYNLPHTPPSTLWFKKSRQLPYYRMHVLNNNTKLLKISPLSRRPGFYPNVPAATYYREIGEMLKATEPEDAIVKNVEKYMKQYMNAHPDATRNDLIERAWMATAYYAIVDDKVKVDDKDVAMAYMAILKKLKLNTDRTGIGFVNSRNRFPSSKMMTPSEGTYIAVVGDTLICPSYMLSMAPGEFPGAFQGEEGGVFYSDFSATANLIAPVPLAVATTQFNRNSVRTVVNLSFDPNADKMPSTFDVKISAAGATKEVYGINGDLANWAAEVEDYLGIPEKDRYKPKSSAAEKVKEAMDEILPEYLENIIGVKPSEVTSYKVEKVGVTPTSKKFVFDVSGKADDLVDDIGDGELLVKVGKLFGDNVKVIGIDRDRQYDAVLTCPVQYVYVLNLELPEGYTVSEADIEALAVNVQNEVGCYAVNAQLSEDGKHVNIYSTERRNVYVVGPDKWNLLLQLVDAAAAFNETTLVLSHK